MGGIKALASRIRFRLTRFSFLMSGLDLQASASLLLKKSDCYQDFPFNARRRYTPNWFGSWITPLPVKFGKQSCSSQTRVVSLRRLQKHCVKGFTLRIPTAVVSIPAWDSHFGCLPDDVRKVLVSSIHIK